MSHVPPLSVARAAARGLALRAQFGRGGTAVGVARARDLSNRRGVSERTLKRMRSYFARHAVDARAAGWGDAQNPSAGWIAWLLWGGDAGRKWAEEGVAMARKNPGKFAAIRAAGQEPAASIEHLENGQHVEFKSPADFRGWAVGQVIGAGNDEYGLWIDIQRGSAVFSIPHPWVRIPRSAKRNPRAEAAWATIEYVAPGEALLLVKSTNGRGIGGDIVRIHRGSKRELYEQAYALAEAYARRAHLPLARMSQVDT